MESLPPHILPSCYPFSAPPPSSSSSPHLVPHHPHPHPLPPPPPFPPLPIDASASTTTFVMEDMTTLPADEESEYSFGSGGDDERLLSQQHQQSSKAEGEVCADCKELIRDRTLLTVNQSIYHEECLRCATCSIPLHTLTTCYTKLGSIFCKPCYSRQFSAKCAQCERAIQSTDWVRRAKVHVYHLACFACTQCKRQLSTGEEFALQEGRILCKQHFVELIEGENGINQAKQKTKRVRTTFAEEQLSVLQAYFQQDSNPDGADLERIANQTGLSKRVTQVWFQNSRARQKKYQGTRKSGGSNGGNRTAEARGEEVHMRMSSEDPTSPGEKSSASSCEGMLFPTSVTTTAEEAICDSNVVITSLQFE